MSESLRRSSRRTTKKNSFKIGDAVEVAKVGVVLKGRLIAQADSTQSTQPRWRVAFDDDTYPDEDLFESALGHISAGSDTESSPTQAAVPAPPPSPSPASIAAAATARKKHRKNGRFVKSTDPAGTAPATGSTAAGTGDGKRSVSFSASEAAAAASDSSFSNSKKTASAREQRRRNRHHTDIPLLPSATTGGHHPHHSKKRPPSTGGGSSKSSKKAKGSGNAVDEEIVKVPMLTGVLYLYKGLHRRAEFHRKV